MSAVTTSQTAENPPAAIIHPTISVPLNKLVPWPDRAYVLVDDVFDVHLLRTEEGLIVDVWEHERELLGTLALENPGSGEE
jgi:hypothetical protein